VNLSRSLLGPVTGSCEPSNGHSGLKQDKFIDQLTGYQLGREKKAD